MGGCGAIWVCYYGNVNFDKSITGETMKTLKGMKKSLYQRFDSYGEKISRLYTYRY